MGRIRLNLGLACFAVLLLLAAGDSATSDETHDLEGYIYDEAGDPIAGVRVIVNIDGEVASERGFATDVDGRYQMDFKKDKGVAKLTFKSDGYHLTGVTELAIGNKLRISKVQADNGPPKTTVGRADTLAAMEYVALAILTTDDENTKATYREIGANLRNQLKTFCGLEKDPKFGWWIKHRTAEVNKLLWQAGIPEEPPPSVVK